MSPHDSMYDPFPVSAKAFELVLQEDDDPVAPLGEVVSDKLQEDPRVRFCDKPVQVHEIDRLTANQKQTLWYNHGDYRAMMQDAGVVPAASSSAAAAASPRRPLPPKWIVRSLWIGSILMGALATSTTLVLGESSSSSASKRSR